jgi:taurine dioxygenase
MALKIVPCDHAGVEIHGVQLRNVSDKEFSLIRDQFLEHGVVFFRDQSLTPEEHIEFARRFGPINVNRFFAKVEGYPEIAQVLKEKDQEQAIGESFHTDHSYDAEPALGSVLVAREVPDVGGATMFVDMHKAYESLPRALKTRIEHLNAIHTSKHVFGGALALKAKGRLGNAAAATQAVMHPVVITHPDSGHKVLFVNPNFTLHFEGMTVAESRPLLEELYRHAARPEHLHRFSWKQGSVALWDNRATWHCAMNDYDGQRRLMHRVTIGGGKLSELNEPDRLASLQLADDSAEVEYNPQDALNLALKEQALGISNAAEVSSQMALWWNLGSTFFCAEIPDAIRRRVARVQSLLRSLTAARDFEILSQMGAS